MALTSRAVCGHHLDVCSASVSVATGLDEPVKGRGQARRPCEGQSACCRLVHAPHRLPYQEMRRHDASYIGRRELTGLVNYAPTFLHPESVSTGQSQPELLTSAVLNTPNPSTWMNRRHNSYFVLRMLIICGQLTRYRICRCKTIVVHGYGQPPERPAEISMAHTPHDSHPHRSHTKTPLHPSPSSKWENMLIRWSAG